MWGHEESDATSVSTNKALVGGLEQRIMSGLLHIPNTQFLTRSPVQDTITSDAHCDQGSL